MKRRKFIKQTAGASAAFTIVPSFVLGGNHIAPSDTLYVACIGVGGRGNAIVNGLHNTKKVKFVALCDVDERRAKDAFKKFPKVAQYKDFRKIYDKHLNEIDAFTVATPDHTHAVVSLPFMRAKKHAYVEKPLTHNIHEARLMTQVAKEHNLVTQMGNIGSSTDGMRTTQEWLDAGVIGRVYKVDCWTNRPVWPQGLKNITEGEPVPKELDWDLWQGPAQERPYHSAYLPFRWRGWWDYGTGGLGDMGCHIMETPFRTLGLGYPYEAEASCTTVWAGDFREANYPSACPPSSVVRLKFDCEKHGKLDLNWYDGGIMPDLPDELGNGETIGNWDGGTVFYGEKGILVTDCYSENPRLLPSERMDYFNKPKPTLKRIKGGMGGHINNWVEGITEGVETSSPFSYAGPLTEAVLMGNLAIKAYQHKVLKEGKTPDGWAPYAYPGRRKLLWDGENMKVTNYDKANDWVTRDYRKGWEVK
jgi:hypothetical protein